MTQDMAVTGRQEVSITMRDGLALAGVLYLPCGSSARRPCIMTMTPYGADNCHAGGFFFAAKGFPFLAVDCRGRGNSEGVFHPGAERQVAKDGYDVVEWLAAQPYCNGKVGMWGGSFSGHAQWMIAKEFPPHLSTIAPVAAPFLGVDTPIRNNIFMLDGVRWLMLTAGRSTNRASYDDVRMWIEIYRNWYESGRAFSQINALGGESDAVFHEWLKHPQWDDYWERHNPSRAEYARIAIPALNITGIYDGDQPGALQHFALHAECAKAAGGAQHYLVIGPWDHAGTRVPQEDFADVRVGRESLIDLNELHCQWYAWTMDGGPKPEFLKDRVTYYVMGADEWRHAGALEECTAVGRPLYLSSEGRADDVFSSGYLREGICVGGPDKYVWDPSKPDGRVVEAMAQTPMGSLRSQRVVLASSGRHLVYHSSPLPSDTEVVGFFRLTVWMAIDRPDTDFYVSVYEIDAEGQSILLSADAMRARYRESACEQKLIQTSEPLRYDFSQFTFVARRIAKGCRLRLVISPIGGLVDVPFGEKNYNAGGIVAEETSVGGRAVSVELYHDDKYPSVLCVPVGRRHQE